MVLSLKWAGGGGVAGSGGGGWWGSKEWSNLAKAKYWVNSWAGSTAWVSWTGAK